MIKAPTAIKLALQHAIRSALGNGSTWTIALAEDTARASSDDNAGLLLIFYSGYVTAVFKSEAAQADPRSADPVIEACRGLEDGPDPGPDPGALVVAIRQAVEALSGLLVQRARDYADQAASVDRLLLQSSARRLPTRGEVSKAAGLFVAGMDPNARSTDDG